MENTNLLPEVRARVERIAQQLYGAIPRVEGLISLNNDVFLLNFAGAQPDKVLKIAGVRSDPVRAEQASRKIRREQTVLRALQSLGLRVPSVEWTQDAFIGVDDSMTERAFFTMPKLKGDALSDTIRTRPEWIQTAWEWAGRFVAEIGQVPLTAFPEAAEPVEREGGWATARQEFDRRGMLRPPFDRIFAEVGPLLLREPIHFIHGDYGASQIITDGQSHSVIDWEGCGSGFPLAMLGRIVAMTREYDSEDGGNEKRVGWLIQGYESIQPLDARERHELHIWEMYNHVGVMSWKFGWEPDHAQHARDMVGRVEQWTYL